MNSRKGRFWPIWPLTLVLISLMLLMTIFTDRVENRTKLTLLNTTITLFSLGMVLLIGDRMRNESADLLKRIAGELSPTEKNTVTAIPLPAVLLGYKGEIIWYNDRFLSELLNGVENVSCNITRINKRFPMDSVRTGETVEIKWEKHWYSVAASPCKGEDSGRFLAYFTDITELKQTEARFTATRPTVMLIVFDNEDELLKARENERMRVISAVDAVINKWAGSREGICWADARDKSLIVMEESEAAALIDDKFSILEEAKSIVAEDGTSVTLSIGVGRGGESIEQCEEWALQSLEMALGRGGDQAVVRTAEGYSFFGGVSTSAERQSKVRIRMLSTSFAELVEGADNCIVMGHRYSDLDSLGAAIGICSLVREKDKEVFLALDDAGTLAGCLRDYYKANSNNYFIHPADALDYVHKDTLLVVVDTHSPTFVESSELYGRCENVVVIDHHRMMVEHIENAKLFIHEPFASSACEIVAEMAGCISENAIGKAEANALLAGIMLDTKNFVLRTGVRTFEAAAFLRRRGADTVEVKRLFAETLESYSARAGIVSTAEMYRGCAIACTEENIKNIRVISSQAADDMLSISDVNASFVIFEQNGQINISGRSFGKVNVQLILERLGGGGHLTMAGVQLSDITMDDAVALLRDSINQQLK